MIERAISIIADKLNQHLKGTFSINENMVEISNVINQDGSVPPNIENKIVAFVVNIERDTIAHLRAPARNSFQSRIPVTTKPAYLNIYLCFAGNFSGKNYRESLKLLSNAIGFFQNHSVFDHSNTPDLDSAIEKLLLEYVNLDIKDLSNLWGVLSGKYIPSVIYKMRMVPVGLADLAGREHAITDTAISAKMRMAPGITDREHEITDTSKSEPSQ